MPLLTSRPSRTTAAAFLAAVLAAAVLVSGTALAPATAAPAKADARHAQAKAVLDKVVAAFSGQGSDRTAPRTSPLPRTDVTVLLRRLRLSMPALNRAERATAAALLGGPTASASCSGGFFGGVVQTQHFCVHYYSNPLLAGFAADDVGTVQQAQLTAQTFEDVYRRQVSGASNSLGFRAPVADGDGLLDVYLLNLGDDRIYGYCNSDDPGSVVAAYCAVDNNFSTAEYGAPPINSLRVTAAHEFFHAVQFAYDANDSSWFLEGTAVWMEDIVYPAINDYRQYLPVSQIRRPWQSADYAGGLAVYGSVVFWKYLSERFRDVHIIRKIWESAAGPRTGIQAVVAVLKSRGYAFGTEFARYGVWNTFPPNSYGDRGFWPSPAYAAAKTLSKAHNQAGYQIRLNHLAHGPFLFRPQARIPTRSKLRVIVDAPDTSHGSQATVQIRYRSGRVTSSVLRLSRTGYASKLYGFNRKYVRSVIVIATNASTGYYDAQNFRVRARLVY
ncbi:hypothetical protein EFK50_04915 [Nocardioides marmoriginsengisoli]|uniref:Uncharacterized protein n=1 Tax=Nocardioides marmoriginsengisoli TaxID=661483 RepID=A0A3N0CPA4_9ACTN|nr:MXAN_6640 family putative metalloprotease [Nocardioides marmoriginsengisoli]RNL65302.1 hypothetical protein EFK50_04915 [Nocardioides marmoriginsengisoli]